MLGSSRTVVQAGQTASCYEADFTPFGGERNITNTCAQSYKFEGKERDAETNNDDFGARYYSSRFGRWLSADWSAVPEPVPYANLSNPQTLNLYAMVADNPETFVDLDGHDPVPAQQATSALVGNASPCAQGGGNPFQCGTNPPNPGQTAQNKQDQQQANQPHTKTEKNEAPPQEKEDHSQQNEQQHPVEISGGGQGGGQQPKGERRQTAKPEFKDKPGKLPKGVRPKPGKQDEYQIKDPHTGNWVDKPRGWSPYAQKVGVAAAIVTGAVLVGRAIAACFASGLCEAAAF